MKTKYNVFGLIKTLEPGEKRHFKLFAQVYEKEGDKNILRLYDVLERMNEYDEATIRKKLGDEKFFNHLHVYKKKLYDAIMKSLRNYHSEDNTNEWLYDSLKDVRLLLKKNLIPDADNLLKKARKLAEEKENHFVLFEISKWQRNITTQTATQEEMERFAIELNIKQKQTIRNIESIVDVSALSLRSWLLYRKYGWPAPEIAKQQYLELIAETTKLVTTQSPLLTRIYAKEILGRSNRALENFEQSFENYYSLIELFKRSPVFMADHLAEYVTCVSNLMSISALLNRSDVTDTFINELQQLSELFPYHITTQVQRRVFEMVGNAALSSNNEKAAYQKNESVIKYVEDGLKKFEGTIAKPIQADFYLNIGINYFLSKKFDLALVWVNKFLNDPQSEATRDIEISIHLLTVLIHAELGNVEYIESVVRMMKRKYPGETTSVTRIGIILQYADEYARVSKVDKLKVLILLRAHINTITPTVTDTITFDYLLLNRWLEEVKN